VNAIKFSDTEINKLVLQFDDLKHKKYPEKQRDYQFEIAEKIFLELPLEFKDKSIVIMDGPFMSIDPVGTKNYFIVGDVVNTVHSRNIGKFRECTVFTTSPTIK
jgi:hypothetical protein